MRLRVYVAGPISKGDRAENIRRGIEAGLRLLEAGYAPMIPHLTDFVEPDSTHGTERYEWWLEHDLAWIAVADALVRLPGASAGADRETAHAATLGIPVYDSVEALIAASPARDEKPERMYLGIGERPTDTDHVNPKDRVGITKVPVGLLPGVATIFGALAMRDGALKYDPYNWRRKKVRMSIYLDAMERHLLALRDGEDVAADSGVEHLGHIIACAAILLDAKYTGNLIDDRPEPGPVAALLERFREAK